ncbi:MAG: hypothetical protein J6Y62_03895 [Clostridia bacterium]|nr:hypothetical protein [Clostridia bacterium]
MREEADRVRGKVPFARAFCKIHDLFKDPRWGHVSAGEIIRKGMSFVGAAPGYLPEEMTGFEDFYVNGKEGIREIMAFPNQDFAAEVVLRLMYRRGACQGDDVIVVNTHTIDWWVRTMKFGYKEVSSFAAMASALIICEHKPDEVRSAMYEFERAAEYAAEDREDERKRIEEEISRLKKKLERL